MKKASSARAFLATILFVSFIILFVNTPKVYGQTPQPTALSATNTSTPIPTATATFTLDQQAGDLLNTYKEVLNTSKNTVDEVHTTANNMLDLIGKMFTALTVVGIAGTGLFTYLGQRASDKANAAQQKTTEALDTIQRTETKTTELEKRNNLAVEATNELTRKQDNLLSQINWAPTAHGLDSTASA